MIMLLISSVNAAYLTFFRIVSTRSTSQPRAGFARQGFGERARKPGFPLPVGSSADALLRHASGLCRGPTRTFKPHPSVYQLAPSRLEIEPEHICFLSSNAWDAFSAKAFGFRVLWCNRFGQQPEGIPALPDAQIETLAALPRELGLEAS